MTTTATKAVHIGKRSTIALALVTIIGIMSFGWPLLADPGPRPSPTRMTRLGCSRFCSRLLWAWSWRRSPTVAWTQRLWPCSACWRLSGRRCARLAPGSRDSNRSSSSSPFGGRAMGRGFGFALGTITLFSSAALTGGIGPWLPFQMLAAGWFGFGAGCLPANLRGRAETLALAGYAAVASLAYGLLLNLSFWPWAVGLSSQISFVPGAPLAENLQRWIAFDIATSLGFDIPRAIITSVVILLIGNQCCSHFDARPVARHLALHLRSREPRRMEIEIAEPLPNALGELTPMIQWWLTATNSTRPSDAPRASADDSLRFLSAHEPELLPTAGALCGLLTNRDAAEVTSVVYDDAGRIDHNAWMSHCALVRDEIARLRPIRSDAAALRANVRRKSATSSTSCAPMRAGQSWLMGHLRPQRCCSAMSSTQKP